MARRWTTREAIEYGHRLPLYDIRGRRILSDEEWKQLGWRKQLRINLTNWYPPELMRPRDY